jgi:hypothetical protein
MGVTASNNASVAFTAFRQYRKNPDNVTVEQLEKLRQQSNVEIRMVDDMLAIFRHSRNFEDKGKNYSIVRPSHFIDIMRKYAPEVEEEIKQEEGEIKDEIMDPVQVDSIGLELAWARQLALVVQECCQDVIQFQEALNKYKVGGYNNDKIKLMGQAVESLGWTPSPEVLGLWLRDCY